MLDRSLGRGLTNRITSPKGKRAWYRANNPIYKNSYYGNTDNNYKAAGLRRGEALEPRVYDARQSKQLGSCNADSPSNPQEHY